MKATRFSAGAPERTQLQGTYRAPEARRPVDNGVILLGGKTTTWDLHLLAVETADRVPGAPRVASLIETEQK